MNKYLEVILEEAVGERGFMAKLRENQVDEQAFARLETAIQQSQSDVGQSEQMSRLLAACLFELPYEIENTVEHYSAQSSELGRRVNKMSESLRAEIQELLWQGLEQYYQ